MLCLAWSSSRDCGTCRLDVRSPAERRSPLLLRACSGRTCSRRARVVAAAGGCLSVDAVDHAFDVRQAVAFPRRGHHAKQTASRCVVCHAVPYGTSPLGTHTRVIVPVGRHGVSSSLQHVTGITVCTCPLANLWSAAGVLFIEGWRRGTLVIRGMACTRYSLAGLRITIKDHLAPGTTRLRLGAQSLVQLSPVDCTMVQTGVCRLPLKKSRVNFQHANP